MICIVCVDTSNGMMFNHRRQSRDSAVVADVIAMAGESGLSMNGYSAKLFADSGCNINISENFLDEAADEYCFVEDRELAPYKDKIEKIIVYKWNRDYPSDFDLDLDLSEWTVLEKSSFAGSSHEEITKEVYVK